MPDIEGFEDRTTALVVLLPAASDPVDAASSEDITHMTFAWFGELDTEQFDVEELAEEVRQYAAEATPITVPVTQRGTLGDDEADVVFLEGTDSLMALRDGLVSDGITHDAVNAVEQYPNWTPHVTLGYPEAPATAEYDGAEITFDRFALWIGNQRQEYPMGKQLTAAAELPDEPDDEVEQEVIDDPDEALVDDVEEIPVHGVLAPEGTPTGDGRMFAHGSLTNRPLPLPIRDEIVGTHGGDTSEVVTVGRIDEIFRHGSEMRFRGVVLMSKPHAPQLIEGIIDGTKRGISVEVDDVELDVSQEREEFIARIKADQDSQLAGGAEEDPDDPGAMSDEEIEALVDAFIGDGTQPLTVFSKARVAGFTVVPIPAYHEAYIALGHEFEDDVEVDEDGHIIEVSEEEAAALAACGCLDGLELEEIDFSEWAVVDLSEDGYEREENGDVVLAPALHYYREVSPDERKRLAKEGKALPDGSFPIANEDDLRNAIQAIGRASDPDKAKAHIKKRARELGKEDLIPEDWSIAGPAAWSVLRENESGSGRFGPFISEGHARDWIAAEGGDGEFTVEHLEPITAAAGTKDGPGWTTHPRATARIRRYWVHGKGAAKIRWGAPGDFNRCRRQLAKYVQNPEWLAGLCANMHFEALGFWPAQHHGAAAVVASGAVAPVLTLVAAATPLPAAAFTLPDEEIGSGVTIDGDRIYGYVAEWGVCHIGIPGVCTTAPHSASGYAYFATGYVDTDEGEIAVGQITMDTGHADIRASGRVAASHYDNTGASVADIAIGENARGIWYAGLLRPSATDEQRHALKASGRLSGDWREFQGNLELVAALAVNVPGFPIRPAALAASAGHQLSLVAAGIPWADAPVTASGGYLDAGDVAAIARAAVAEYVEIEKLNARRAETRELRNKLRADRVSRIKQKIGMEN